MLRANQFNADAVLLRNVTHCYAMRHMVGMLRIKRNRAQQTRPRMARLGLGLRLLLGLLLGIPNVT